MFRLLFKYPTPVFSKGQLVLLSGWPKWLLLVLFIAAAAGLALMIRLRLPQAAPHLQKWRLAVIWALESALVGLLLLLLWRPALMIAELKPHQNIVAVLVDDSRSMGLAESGVTRETQATRSLQSGALGSLQQKFQTYLYRLDRHIARISGLAELKGSASSTRIDDGLKQLMEETSGLPLGAVVLLSDGSDNTGGIERETIAALRERRVPVYTVGFGPDEMARDVEIEDVQAEPRALAGSRMAATVSFRQRGYSGKKSVLRVSDGEKAVGEKEITFAPDGELETQTVLFDAGAAGHKALQFSVSPQPGETNANNNALTRNVQVESGKRRLLYVEGEPRWEYKFIRRAEDEDPMVELASMVRTTANNVYRQGLDNPGELADGFPTSNEDLFKYQGLIIGSVEAAYFTPAQQEIIKEFVDRRGGGILFLGGRFALADGGWGASSVVDLLPVILPNRKDTFQRDPARAELTPAGADSIICRLAESPGENATRWKKLPYMLNYQDPGKPKPGAVVLARMSTGRGKLPFLVVENYGHGRTALLATGGTWRWQMQLPLEDHSHDIFWRQLLRWLVTGTPGQLVVSVTNPILYDSGNVQLSAQVRDKDYLPESNARVEAHISGPSGDLAAVELAPSTTTPGLYQGEWTAPQPGKYQAQVSARLGDAIEVQEEVSFERMDGVAENFHTEQNRELLQQLSRQTGGRYWRPQDLSSKLASEIPYSEAGITTREAKELWNMPAVFLLIIALKASEWLLRRKWGIL
ncbi:MAG TPA: glutamine amidotransferase [Terriglobia bacterium]|nr:glutamine amidotransferase [Terriglobia bacterium]